MTTPPDFAFLSGDNGTHRQQATRLAELAKAALVAATTIDTIVEEDRHAFGSSQPAFTSIFLREWADKLNERAAIELMESHLRGLMYPGAKNKLDGDGDIDAVIHHRAKILVTERGWRPGD